VRLRQNSRHSLPPGDWVPGRRTTLEFLPAVWMFGDNTDYVGQTLKTDPLFQLDVHLTRDFTERFWVQIVRLLGRESVARSGKPAILAVQPQRG
jgi:hypothetical protein